MKLLFLGGTAFVGRHAVGHALARGHAVTLFNRGQRANPFGREVESLQGDRSGDLAALANRTWDAVIDLSGQLPRAVRHSATLLAPMVERYLFVSSRSVYAPAAGAVPSEASPLLSWSENYSADDLAASTPELYGALKALCEQEVERALPGRTLVVRPGAIVGAWDTKDRLTYWVRRAAGVGEMLAPGDPSWEANVLDGADLGAWLVAQAEQQTTGTYNVAGRGVAFAALLEACRAVTGGKATSVWVDEPSLERENVAPWSELPLWVPTELRHEIALDDRRIQAAGFVPRPLADTLRATWEWDRERGDLPLQAGLTAEREAEVLAACRASA